VTALTINMPDGLGRALRREAGAQGASEEAWAIRILESALRGEEGRRRLAERAERANPDKVRTMLDRVGTATPEADDAP